MSSKRPTHPRGAGANGVAIGVGLIVMVAGLFYLPAVFVTGGFNFAGEKVTEDGSDRTKAISASEFHALAAGNAKPDR